MLVILKRRMSPMLLVVAVVLAGPVLGWLVGSIDFEALLALRPDLDRVSLEEMKAQVLAGQLEPTSGESLVLRVGAVVSSGSLDGADSWPVNAIHLMRSDFTPGSAVYSSLGSVRL